MFVWSTNPLAVRRAAEIPRGQCLCHCTAPRIPLSLTLHGSKPGLLGSLSSLFRGGRFVVSRRHSLSALDCANAGQVLKSLSRTYPVYMFKQPG